MTPLELILRAESAACLVILLVGAVWALGRANALKRVMGLLMANTGAIAFAATMAAHEQLLLAGLGVSVAYLVVGSALSVRLQEASGGSGFDDGAPVSADAAAGEPR